MTDVFINEKEFNIFERYKSLEIWFDPVDDELVIRTDDSDNAITFILNKDQMNKLKEWINSVQ